jgi:hypothetical protein
LSWIEGEHLRLLHENVGERGFRKVVFALEEGRWETCYIPLIVLHFEVVSKKVCSCSDVVLMLILRLLPKCCCTTCRSRSPTTHDDQRRTGFLQRPRSHIFLSNLLNRLFIPSISSLIFSVSSDCLPSSSAFLSINSSLAISWMMTMAVL